MLARDEGTRTPSACAKHQNSVECITESLIHHVLAKHGTTREAVDAHLNSMGVTFGQTVAGILRVVPHALGAELAVDPKKADAAANDA